MKKQLRWIVLVLVLLFLVPGGLVSAESPITPVGIDEVAACGSVRLLISEVDYADPNSSQVEFVELNGQGGAALTDYELHFVDGGSAEATVYRVVSLADQTLADNGYFVVAGAGLNLSTGAQLTIEQANFIYNNGPNGIGLYDTVNGAYCNFVNYEGTVAGFGAWLNIGEDLTGHGPDRGCSLRDSGSWLCNRPITPGFDNAPLAVTLSQTAANPTANLLWLSVFAGLLLLGTAVVVRQRVVIRS
jgi:hypothetical protein